MSRPGMVVMVPCRSNNPLTRSPPLSPYSVGVRIRMDARAESGGSVHLGRLVAGTVIAPCFKRDRRLSFRIPRWP